RPASPREAVWEAVVTRVWQRSGPPPAYLDARRSASYAKRYGKGLDDLFDAIDISKHDRDATTSFVTGMKWRYLAVTPDARRDHGLRDRHDGAVLRRNGGVAAGALRARRRDQSGSGVERGVGRGRVARRGSEGAARRRHVERPKSGIGREDHRVRRRDRADGLLVERRALCKLDGGADRRPARLFVSLNAPDASEK